MMSDVMLLGVLRMPIPDSPDPLTLHQFVSRARQAADRIESDADEIERLRAEVESLRKDAERYRHAMAYGWPMKGPQCVAWTREGHMVLADTQEAAIDAAMKEPK